MGTSRHSYRDVLKDNSGLSTSIAETLGALSLKTITMVMVGGLLASLIVFWGVTTATADTSSGFQTANLGFEKAVSASDVVVGVNTDRIALLTDTTGVKCKVETWQSGARDGGIALRVDTKTVAGVCTPTTALIAPKAGDVALELMFGIKAPAFTYSNLGGRVITFNATGASTLVTGTMPAGVKLSDWNDTRPYKVALRLETLDTDAALVTKKAVLSAFTNVVNIAAAAADLRYVPSPSTDPVPGPLHITGVDRSPTTGTVVGGVHEGLSVSFSGGVCPSGPTTVSVAYVQQSPSVRPAVSTVYTGVLTGAFTSVHLASVANGSSGAADVSATCISGGVAEKDSTGFTQTLPATALTVTQNAVAEKHNLSWTAVSSLPTSFQIEWTSPSGLLTTDPAATSALSMTTTQTDGSTYGLKTDYQVIASVDGNTTAPATGNITTPWPAPSVANSLGWTYQNVNSRTFTWANGAACPAGTTKQTRTNLNLLWNRSGVGMWANFDTSPWVANDTSNVSTAALIDQGYPFQYEVTSKCVSAYSESASLNTQSDNKWNGWNTPSAPVYNARTEYRKTEQPAGSVYDICRNHGTSTCSNHPGYGNSIQLIYNVSCPAGSWMGASNVHSRSWSNGNWDQAINSYDGWETGGSHRQVWYSAAHYQCNNYWNSSPQSGDSGEQMIWVWAW